MKKLFYVGLAGLTILAPGCVTRVYVPPPPAAVQPGPPPPVAQVPPPGPVAYVPDYYVWDGYEYVGVCGNQYVYWNAGGWVLCDAVILGRFHGWERYHGDWRRGAFRYHPGREPFRR